MKKWRKLSSACRAAIWFRRAGAAVEHEGVKYLAVSEAEIARLVRAVRREAIAAVTEAARQLLKAGKMAESSGAMDAAAAIAAPDDPRSFQRWLGGIDLTSMAKTIDPTTGEGRAA